MANKYDLKTWKALSWSSTVAPGAATNIGSSEIDAGKTRFLTYIRVSREENIAGTISKPLAVRIGSVATGQPTNASMASAAKHGVLIPLRGPSKPKITSLLMETGVELKGSIDEPIMSVAGGTGNRFMGLNMSGANACGVDVTAQYYDE